MPERSVHRTPSFPSLVGCVALVLLVAAIGFRGRNDSASDVGEARNLDANSIGEVSAGSTARDRDKRFATTIRRPSGPPVIELRQSDPQGRVGSVACSTCHGVREPNFNNRVPADLDQFHQNMPIDHGSLTCYSCHNPSDADTLRLADSTPVNYPDVMTLCSQCHGSQAKDYEHGAHGGMNGYWDLSRGPRTRNNCIDCHDPHVPKFPTMQPKFKPRDRFLEPHASVSGSSLSYSEVDGE